MHVFCTMHVTLMYTIMFLNVAESVCYTDVYNHVPLMLHEVSQTCIIHHCYIHVIYNMSQLNVCIDPVPGAHEEKEHISCIHRVIISKNKVILADSHSCKCIAGRNILTKIP